MSETVLSNQKTGSYQKSLATIAKILDAAELRFVAKTFDDIKLTDIAKDAGVTKGAIYHHFVGKDDLFLQMMKRYLQIIETTLKDAVAEGSNTQERLFNLTYRYLSLPLAKQKVIQLVRRDSRRFSGEQRKELIGNYQDALPLVIESIFQDAIDCGEIKGDARLLSWQFVASVEVCLSDVARAHLGDPDKQANYLIDVFFNGVNHSTVLND